MSPSFRPSRAVRPLILPLALLGCLLAAGCTSMLSPLASSSGSATADQTRTEAWLQSLTGLTPMEQARRAEQAQQRLLEEPAEDARHIEKETHPDENGKRNDDQRPDLARDRDGLLFGAGRCACARRSPPG